MSEDSATYEVIDILVRGSIIKDPTSGWLCVEMKDSSKIFSARMPIKVSGTIEGIIIDTTLMPMGNGNHMIPIRADIRKKLKKDLGSEVTFHFTKRKIK